MTTNSCRALASIRAHDDTAVATPSAYDELRSCSVLADGTPVVALAAVDTVTKAESDRDREGDAWAVARAAVDTETRAKKDRDQWEESFEW